MILLDSAGLRVLMHTYIHAREHGGSIRLAALRPLVAQVIRVVKIDSYVPVHDTVAAALHAALTDAPPTMPVADSAPGA